MEQIKMNKEDAQTVLKLIRLIENMSLSNYEKNWRKIHKKAGVSAQYKIKVQDFALRVDGNNRRNIYAYETKNKKKKEDKFRWLNLTYKNYAYRVTYDTKTNKFETQSAFNVYGEERIIVRED